MVHPVGVHRELENGLAWETHKFSVGRTLGALKDTDHSNLQLRRVFPGSYSGKFSSMNGFS